MKNRITAFTLSTTIILKIMALFVPVLGVNLSMLVTVIKSFLNEEIISEGMSRFMI